MRVIERNQLRLLPRVEDGTVNLPGLGLITAVVHADAELGAAGGNGQPGIAITSIHGSYVFTLPGMPSIGRLVKTQPVGQRIAKIQALLRRINKDGPHRSIWRRNHAGPTGGVV